MKKILNHWCLYYVWALNYFDRGDQRKAKEVAGNLVFVPIAMYLMLYLVVPIIAVFTAEKTNLLREYGWILILIAAIFIGPIIGYLSNLKYVKSRIEELLAIDDWENSLLNKKGRNIFLFHLIFTFASIPISMVIGFVILRMISGN